MGTGTVVRFDRAKGFGFIAPDCGGEDLFLHASVFRGTVPNLRGGVRVRFGTVLSERGVRAVDVEVISPPAESAPGANPGNDGCDVLSPARYGQEITQVLSEELSAITAVEMSRIRARLVAAAGRRRWLGQDEN